MGRHSIYSKRRSRKRSRGIVDAFVNQLKLKPCEHCGVKYNPWQMQFDHIDPRSKKKAISQLTTISSVIKEVSKCRLLCANCHATVTYLSWRTYREKKEAIDDLQLTFLVNPK